MCDNTKRSWQIQDNLMADYDSGVLAGTEEISRQATEDAWGLYSTDLADSFECTRREALMDILAAQACTQARIEAERRGEDLFYREVMQKRFGYMPVSTWDQILLGAFMARLDLVQKHQLEVPTFEERMGICGRLSSRCDRLSQEATVGELSKSLKLVLEYEASGLTPLEAVAVATTIMARCFGAF